MATVENAESSQAQWNQQTCERLHSMGCCFAFLGRSWMRPKLGWLNVFWQRPKTRLVKGDRDRRRRMMMMMMFFPSENGFCSLETAESPKSLGSFWFFPQVCCYAG